jgi:TetR/AcrR family transcriptional regulator, fatty acid metabolism regulator protein
VFGTKGYDNATISDICKAARISDATLYEYFVSKEDVLFTIPERYNKKAYDHIRQILPHIEDCRQKIRFIVRYFLQFYESHRLYTSVALLLLKTNRKHQETPSYALYRKLAREIVNIFNEGVEKGDFRDDISPYIVRNMVLGFIEHLVIQWLLVARPESPTEYIEMVNDMIIRSIEKERHGDEKTIRLKVDLGGPLMEKAMDILSEKAIKRRTKKSVLNEGLERSDP